MNYKFYLIYLITLVLLPGVAHAQQDRYRVEILLLTHLQHAEEPAEAALIEDYSGATDFLTQSEMGRDEAERGEAAPGEKELTEKERALADCLAEVAGEEAEIAAVEGETLAAADGETPGEGLAGAAGAEEDEDAGEADAVEIDPNAVIHVEEMSDTMREAWRRLRLSAPFRPEQYLSWEQGSEAPFPSLRLHDLDLVMTDDPWFDTRRELLIAELLAQAEEKVREDEDRKAGIIREEAALPDCEELIAEYEERLETPEEAEPGLPDSVQYYRLDGTVMLKRSRFLHLDLDLQLREAAPEEEQPLPLEPGLPATAPQAGESARESTEGSAGVSRPALPPGIDPELLAAIDPEVLSAIDPQTLMTIDPKILAEIHPDTLPESEQPPQPTSFVVHGLRQSRQVKTGRMEYFDGAVLGVLAYITKIQPEDESGEEL